MACHNRFFCGRHSIFEWNGPNSNRKLGGEPLASGGVERSTLKDASKRVSRRIDDGNSSYHSLIGFVFSRSPSLSLPYDMAANQAVR
jgi:hypothetical protein